MGKYEEIEQKVYDVFDGDDWKAQELKTFPVGFEGDKGDPPYLRLTLVYTGAQPGTHLASGVLMIEIFAAWGVGPRPVTQIADILDGFLERKSRENFQFSLSTLSAYTRDKDNPGLGRSIYSLPFTRFGV